MLRRCVLRSTIPALLLLVALAGPASAETVWPAGARPAARHPELSPVSYQLSIERAYEHMAHVVMRIEGYSPTAPLEVAMPAWAPGAYHLTVPAKNVLRPSVRSADGDALGLERLDRQTWRIHGAPEGGAVVVEYSVYHKTASVVRSHVTSGYAGINGFDTFLYVVGNVGTPCELQVVQHRDWEVATGLPRTARGWRARDYDVLIDSPLLWGQLEKRVFTVQGKPHYVVWSGENDYDIDRLAQDTQRIVEAVIPMFGGALPYDDYWFLWRFDRGVGGGLEHLNSTRINNPHRGYANPDRLDRYWSVTAHEYVHTWNVKRIRPVGLGPFDYTQEVYTPYLWFSEGFTSYLGDLALLRAGIWTGDRFLRSLAAEIQTYRATPAREWMSPAESSMTTWHKAENGLAGRVNYYNAGQLIALTLDMELRRRTGGQRTLVDLTRALWERFRQDGRPFAPGAIRATADRLVDQEGAFEAFFREHVDGARPLPIVDALSTVGLLLRRKLGRKIASLGVSTKAGQDAEVTAVAADSAAEAAGIRPGDVIVAVAGARASGVNLAGLIRRHQPGDRVSISLFRDDRLQILVAVLDGKLQVGDPMERASFRKVHWRLMPDPNAPPELAAELRRWLQVTGHAPRVPPADAH